jgi:hypothetical protein
MKFFKKIKKLEHEHLLEIAGLSASVMLLVFGAVFVGSGGMSRINHLLAVAHIIPGSQTASVFPSNSTSYSLVGLYFAQGQASTVGPGASVQWVWNAGTYGANTFSQACFGSNNSNYQCNLGTSAVYSWPLPSGSGNIDAYLPCSSGGFCNYTSVSGGNSFTGVGYPGGYITLTAPTSGGTYTYYMCSYWIEHKYGAGAGCASQNLTVLSDNCPATPTAVSGGLQVPPGTYHVVSQGNDFCVTNNSGKYMFVPANSATELNNFKSATQGYLSGTAAYFARQAGY